jgi:23S rRNA (uracil1939-C5)-methyltransferase
LHVTLERDVVELDIERLAYGGDAISHLEDGRTVFVRLACPGDRVLAEIVEDRERFVRAEVREILSASPDRVKPPCPYFGECGGCQWQHIGYPAQLTAKRASVVDALVRIGKIETAEKIVSECVASPAQYGYRNKVEFEVDTTTGRPRLGYHRLGSDEVLPVDECLLLPKKLRSAPKALGGALRYASGETDLGLARVALRVAANTNEVEIALWSEPGAFPRKAVAGTLGTAVRATSIVRVLAKGPTKERKVTGVEVLAGKGHWRERIGQFEYLISAPSFFQVNTKAAEKLVELAVDALRPDGSDRVADLYAGAGTFTLPLAEKAGEVVAIEGSGPAVRDLRRNLEVSGVWVDVVGGDAAREMGSLGRFDLVLVDPPRAGLKSEAVEAIAHARPRALAYVSCDPATLARDTAALAEHGYALKRATPVDLFPQTYHVETLALFESE